MYSSFFAKSFMTSFKIVFSVEISEFSDQLRCETICNKVEMYRNVFYRYLKQFPDLLLLKSKKTTSNDNLASGKLKSGGGRLPPLVIMIINGGRRPPFS